MSHAVAGTLPIAGIAPVEVFIATEDHPPPHVHAEHPGEGWRARFRFSFLSDVAGLYGVIRAGRRPRTAQLKRIEDAIVRDLGMCRAEWWATHGSRHGIGLVNRRAEVRQVPPAMDTRPNGLLVKVALSPGRDAVAIVSAAYDPAAETVTLVLADGRRFRLKAGQHIEEAEEWT